MTEPVKQRLLRKAAMNKNLSARVAVALSKEPKLLTAEQRRDLVEAIRLARGLDKQADAAGVTQVEKMPGFSPAQLRAQLDKIAKIRQEHEILRKQYEAALKQMADLEKAEADGVKKLKTAAEKMKDTGKFVAEAESALLEWTAYTQEKRPGIEQMIAKDTENPEKKAGDLFGRIAAELGGEVAEKVEAIYKNCSEDLTQTAYVLRGLKVVVKTSSLHPDIVKKAGILDAIGGFKDWLAGKTHSAVKALIHFGGTLKEWVKGFENRELEVEKAAAALKKSMKKAQMETDKLLKAA